MVQSLGISVGNSNSYVAAGQGGGVETLLNDYSNRSTPSMVAFTDQFRAIGTEASSNFFVNMKNTIYDLMVLLGRPFKEIQTQDSDGEPLYPFKLEEGPDGQTMIVARHLGEERKFTIVQVLAMLFTKLRGIAGDSVDCVLSCPQFYTNDQKSALFQAALVAGLNPLQVISDMSAVVLNYAYYRTTKEDGHKFVVFINFGQSNLQTAVAILSPKDDAVMILAAESDSVGGIDFDRCLAKHFIKTHNLKLNQKSKLKLTAACEKLKRQLSANTNDIPINVESLLGEDKDFTSKIDRATFEMIAQPLFERVELCLKKTLEVATNNYELYLASLKKPATPPKPATKAAKPKAGAADSATSEAVAGAQADQNNSQSPIDPSAEQPMDVSEQQCSDEQANETSDKTKGQTPTELDAEKGDTAADTTTESDKLPAPDQASKQPPSADKTNAKTAAATPEAEPRAPAADLAEAARIVEIVGGSSRIPAVRKLIQSVFGIVPSTTQNTDEAVVRGCVLQCASLHPGMKVKRDVRIVNMEPFTRPNGLTCDKDMRRIELELITEDCKYRSRTEARNNLEEFIYSERSRLKEGDEFLAKLSEELDWLFSDEGDEAPEEVYQTKLLELKNFNKT